MPKKFKNIKKRLSKIYRFVIVNDQTHENLFRIKASALKVILLGTLFFCILCALIFSIIAYTPLKQVLPGYPSYQTQRAAIENATKVDSLESRIRVMTIQLTNIQRIIKGEAPLPIDSLLNIGKVEQAEKLLSGETVADSILRHKVDSIERYNLSNNRNIEQITIKTFKIEQDDTFGFKNRGGAAVGKRKYKIIDENHNVYLLSTANDKDLFFMFAPQPTFHVEIEFLKKSR